MPFTLPFALGRMIVGAGLQQATRNAVRVLPTALAGVPIALGAIQELYSSPDSPMAGVAGAAGEIGGGIGGGLGGAAFASKIDRRLAPVGFALGGMLGGGLGSGAASGLARAAEGFYSDPLRKQLENQRRTAEMLREQSIASMPLQRAQSLVQLENLQGQLMAQAAAQGMIDSNRAVTAAATGNYGGFVPGV